MVRGCGGVRVRVERGMECGLGMVGDEVSGVVRGSLSGKDVSGGDLWWMVVWGKGREWDGMVQRGSLT